MACVCSFLISRVTIGTDGPKSYLRLYDSENHPCKALVFILIIMPILPDFCEVENDVSSKIADRK